MSIVLNSLRFRTRKSVLHSDPGSGTREPGKPAELGVCCCEAWNLVGGMGAGRRVARGCEPCAVTLPGAR